MQEEELPTNDGVEKTERGRTSFQGLLSGVKNVFVSNTPAVTKIQEVLPPEAVGQYNLLLENEAPKTYLFRDIPADNATIAQPEFCNPLDAYLVARCPLLWSRVSPLKAKGASSADKVEMRKLASISPFFYLKSLEPSKSGVEFDSFVVDAFLSDPTKNGISRIEGYFHNSAKRELKKDYEDFVNKCAEFLPAVVQGDLLCVLMSANPLQDGSRPFRDAILSRDDIVVKFVVFQYAKRIERIIERMQESYVELAVSPDKTLMKKLTTTAKVASGQDAVFNREKKIFAKFVGLRLIKMLAQYLHDKSYTKIELNKQEECVNWASYATPNSIYQLILKAIKADEPGSKYLFNIVDFFQTHFDNFLFGGANNEVHILIDFTEQCDKGYKPDLQQFRDLVNEIKAEVGVKLLLAESNDARYLGIQEIFNGPKVPASLGILLLSNANTEQLLFVASRFPNSGACFRSNTEQFFIPLLELIAQRHRELDLDVIRRFLAGCDREVFLRLDPGHYATLLAINPDDCVAPVADYLQNSKRDPAFVITILNYDNVTPEVAKLVLGEFGHPFIAKICDSLAVRQDVRYGALVKLLLCQQREITGAILALLKKNRAAIFSMFEVKYCNQDVIGMLESILLDYLERQDNDHSELIRHISKYLRCRGVVAAKKDTFFAICKNDPDVRVAVFTAVIKDHDDSQLFHYRDWVLPLLRKIILAVDDQEWLKSRLNYVPKLLELDPSVAEALLGRRAIVEALEAENNLTYAHWLIMINLLLSNRGQNLLASEVLQKELIVRLCMLVEKNQKEQPAAIDKLFANEFLGRLVLMQLKYPARVILFNTANAKLVQQLFRLYDHESIRVRLYEIMACCLADITNEAFFELAFQQPKWLQYILQFAHPVILDHFIRLLHDKPWVAKIRLFRLPQPDPFLGPVRLEPEESMHELSNHDLQDDADDASEEDQPSPIPLKKRDNNVPPTPPPFDSPSVLKTPPGANSAPTPPPATPPLRDFNDSFFTSPAGAAPPPPPHIRPLPPAPQTTSHLDAGGDEAHDVNRPK